MSDKIISVYYFLSKNININNLRKIQDKLPINTKMYLFVKLIIILIIIKKKIVK